MGNAKDLAGFRQGFEFASDHLGDPAPNPGVYFVKYQSRDLFDRCQDALQGKHDTRHLTAGGDFRQWTRLFSRIRGGKNSTLSIPAGVSCTGAPPP